MAKQSDSVCRIIEVVRISDNSWEDAGRHAKRPQVYYGFFAWPKLPS